MSEKSSKQAGTEETKATVEQRTHGSALLFRFKKWEDFCEYSSQAERLSFLYDMDKKTFQVDALKSGQTCTYGGPLPEFDALLKSWLSKELDISFKAIFKGSFCPL